MKTKWKLRQECFHGPGSYTLEFGADTEKVKLPVDVNEGRYFEIDQEPPRAINSVAQKVARC